jgi:hypothetical protein
MTVTDEDFHHDANGCLTIRSNSVKGKTGNAGCCCSDNTTALAEPV